MKKINFQSSRVLLVLALFSLVQFAMGQSSGLAYIPNAFSDNVSIINTFDNSVIGTVAVGNEPFGVGITPDGHFVYISNGGANTISQIDAISNTVVSTFYVGTNPCGVTVSPDGSKLFVSHCGPDSLTIINTADNSILAKVLTANHPDRILFSPDGTKAYLGHISGNVVRVINTTTYATIADIPCSGLPHEMAITASGDKIYVACHTSNNVKVISTATNTITATIATGSNPWGICISPDGSKVFAGNITGNSVSVINTATNTVIHTIPATGGPHGVAVTPDGSKLYVSCAYSDDVKVFDAATYGSLATVAVGDSPFTAGSFIGNSNCPFVSNFTFVGEDHCNCFYKSVGTPNFINAFSLPDYTPIAGYSAKVATIYNSTVNNFYANQGAIAIGLRDNAAPNFCESANSANPTFNNCWAWADGTEIGFRSWMPNQPDNLADEDFVYFGSTNLWNDGDGSTNAPFALQLTLNSATTIYYADADGDGFGKPNTGIHACGQPAGMVTNATDCDDNNPTTYPAAPEICSNNLDDNCDNQTDENNPTVSFTYVKPSCVGSSNGKITAKAAPGTTGYTYLWNTGSTNKILSNVPAGTYTCVVTKTSTGCMGTGTAILSDPIPVTVSGTATNPTCFGNSNGKIVAVAAGGTGGKTYLWNTGATTATILNLAAANYSMTATDSKGCTGSASFSVGQPTEVVVSLVSIVATTGGNFKVTLNATGGVTFPAPKTHRFNWRVNGSMTWNYATWSSLKVFTLAPGTYDFAARDKNLCEDIITVVVPPPPSQNRSEISNENFDEKIAHSVFSISPNPFENQFVITAENPIEKATQVQIFDAAGRLVFENAWQKQTGFLKIENANWTPGIYFVKILDENGSQLAIEPVVKMND